MSTLVTWIKSLFEFFISLFRSRQACDDLWSPRERILFRYFNGEKQVLGDPLVLYKRMLARTPKLTSDSPQEEIVAAVRDVFAIKLQANGVDCAETLTDLEVIALWTQFLAYCESVRPSAVTSPPPQQEATATTSNSPSTPPTAQAATATVPPASPPTTAEGSEPPPAVVTATE